MAKSVNSANLSAGLFKDFYRKHPILSHIFFICLAFMAMIWLALIFLDFWTHHGDTTDIPNVLNTSQEYAMAQLKSSGFDVEVSDSVYDAKYSPGTVISTWPRPGATVKSGREVYLTIASYQPRQVTISMPIKNVSSRQALKYLESLDIKNVRIVNVQSQFADLVLGAKYKGRDIEPGMSLPINAEVILEVGTVPNVVEVDVDEMGIDMSPNDFEPEPEDNDYSTSSAYD